MAKAGPSPSATDGRIDREAIFQYLPCAAAPFVVAADIAPGTAAAPALFGLIDANHDGQLSKAELAGAAARLVVRDFDDDGLISERELIVDPTQHAERTTEEETLAQTTAKAATLIWMGGETTNSDACAVIVRRYDRDGDGKLLVVGEGESVEMNLSAEAIRRLDANARRPARRRRARMLCSPIRARLSCPWLLALAVPRARPSPLRRASRAACGCARRFDGGFKIYVDDAQIDVNRNNGNPQQNSGLELRFTRFDADKSGYLDMKEVAGRIR